MCGINNISVSVQVMACCRQPALHNPMAKKWLFTPSGITRPRWVNIRCNATIIEQKEQLCGLVGCEHGVNIAAVAKSNVRPKLKSREISFALKFLSVAQSFWNFTRQWCCRTIHNDYKSEYFLRVWFQYFKPMSSITNIPPIHVALHYG